MELKALSKKYKAEMWWVIFIALTLIILAFTLNKVFDLTRTEAFLLNMNISFVGLIISVMLILRKTIELSFGPIKDILARTNEIKDILTRPIPKELPSALRRLLEMEEKDYTEAYDVLTKGGRYTVQKTEMYQNLIKFANAMSAENSDEILAISSVDISDFQNDPHAEIYLHANEECVGRGVPVKRIFLLSDHDLRTRDAVNIIKTHGEKLSDVKWVEKRFLTDDERDQDLAIFNDCIIVEQKLTREYQIVISEPNEINVAKRRFNQILNNPKGKSWEIIEDEWRRRTGK